MKEMSNEGLHLVPEANGAVAIMVYMMSDSIAGLDQCVGPLAFTAWGTLCWFNQALWKEFFEMFMVFEHE